MACMHYCTHYFDCSVTWYSRVATTQQTRVTTTCNSTHSTTPPHSLPPIHSPSPPAHKSPTALCPPTRLTLGAPATSPCNAASSVALGRDTTSLPPVPLLHVVMHATRRPLSCLILGCDTMPPLPRLSFRALSFFFLFFFFLFSLFPVTAPLLSQVHGDPSLPANVRGSEAAARVSSQAPLEVPSCCIPLIASRLPCSPQPPLPPQYAVPSWDLVW